MRFTRALQGYRAAGRVPVIPDLKCRSPQEGDLFGGRDPLALAEALRLAGAPALSVVTEGEHFGGSLSLLWDVAAATGLPVLRKDFIRTETDVEETKNAGGAAVLLIVAMLDPEALTALLRSCAARGLDALVEVHTAAELEVVNRLAPPLVGINNRDILRLERDGGTVHNTAALAAMVRRPALVVSESAIETPRDVDCAARAGADAVLVGTALLRAEDIGAKYREMSVPLP